MAQRYRVGLVAALLVSALALSSRAMASNIVLNPGFETGTFANWGNQGWEIQTVGPIGGLPHTGSFFAETGCVGAGCINPVSGAFIYQDLATTPGQTYILSFWYFPDRGTPNELQVLWNGGLILDLTNLGSGQTYAQYIVPLTAPLSTTTRLEFLGRQDPAWLGVDDVCVDVPGAVCGNVGAAVPEPTSLVLMGTALIGLVRVVRRRS